ncbi:HNH endonuclease family protein [Dactylosporangium salmoneum]|uniref:GmrSD restriction endonucleases C-terminal domain-containing protein n=1 Tax=Dactylosporangium salmoneum TaxID=53361 RepID=A0ABP5TUB1_9ACTN
MDSEWRTHARWPDVPPSWSGRATAARPRRLLVAAALLGAFLLGLAAATWAGTQRPASPHQAAEAADLTGLDATTAVPRPDPATPAAPAVAPSATTPAPAPSPSLSPSAEQATADVADVLAEVYQLKVADNAAGGGYARARFGPAWSDVDGNGCDTRNDVLRRDLRSAVTAPDCTVVSGVLVDPYGGSTLAFQRGTTSADVEIDHVVALADAWRSGASAWTDERRLAFANDPRELLATTAQQNRAKGDANAASWLPANGRCAYVALQVEVKSAYGLSVTTAERDAFVATLTSCGCAPATG